MCGTPVISSDWAVFNETVLHGVTGYRCRTLDQFIYAVNNVDNLDYDLVYEWAQNFSTDKVAGMYQEYFSALHCLWGEGWYTMRDDVNGEWLTKNYPQFIKLKHTPAEATKWQGNK